MQQGGLAECRSAVCLELLVNQEWESDSGIFAKRPGVVHTAESDGGNVRAFFSKLLFVFAQLRDVLATEDSTPVAQKNQNYRSRRPEGAQRNLLALRVRQNDSGKPAAESGLA